MTPRLYQDLAHLWPLLSPWEDYIPEATRIREVLEAHWCDAAGVASTTGSRRSILELGAGGGHTLCHLAADFETFAVDLSDAMLANLLRLTPSTRPVVDDMRSVRLGRVFDAVLIHDAIDYMLTTNDLRRTFATAAAHLEPGGVLIVAPTYVTETFVDHDMVEDVNADDRTELRYVSHVRRDPAGRSAFTMDMIMLIRTLAPGAGRHAAGSLRIEHDRHRCGLFAAQTWIDLIVAAGFDVSVDRLLEDTTGDEPGIPMFVGIRR